LVFALSSLILTNYYLPLSEVLPVLSISECIVIIRKDLKEVEPLIGRLLSLGEEFGRKDSYWSHLKNKEDWEQFIYSFSDGRERAVAERIYCDGRDMGLSLYDDLGSINFDLTKYPNLTAIVHKFDGGWVYEELTFVIKEAKEAANNITRYTWAFNEMLKTFQEQIDLAAVVKQTLNLLKNSDLYKLENGMPIEKEQAQNIHIAQVSNSNIAVNSSNVTQSVDINEQLFEDILKAIDESDIEDKAPLIAATEEMKTANKAGGLGETYKNFINSAASHMTVVAPFIPALTALL